MFAPLVERRSEHRRGFDALGYDGHRTNGVIDIVPVSGRTLGLNSDEHSRVELRFAASPSFLSSED
jgi:hypothetical protein